MSKLYKSKEWLRKRYVFEKISIEEMAVEAGASTATIRRALKEHKIIK